MKVCIHRGTQQIGGSCIEIQHADARIVLDLGLPLDASSPSSTLLPAVNGFNAFDAGLLAVIISHPHQDHYGLAHLLPKQVPVLIGAAAKRILQAAAPFTGQALPRFDGPALQDRCPINIGPFTITPYLVDHSAYDAYALKIEAGGKTLFYSGDFRGHGRKAGLFEAFLAQPPHGVDVLLMEGSVLGRLHGTETYPTEADLEAAFAEEFKASPGLVMVNFSSQNIDRLVTVMRACKRENRRLVIDLYTAVVLEATENKHLPQSDWDSVALLVPQRQRLQIKRHGWFETLKRHAKNRVYYENLAGIAANSVLLFRPLMQQDLEATTVLHNARFIYSQWSGYLAHQYADMAAWLTHHRIPMTQIHTSGHASISDLKRFCQAIAPKQLVPIHTEFPDKFMRHFEQVTLRNDGEWWSV